MQSDSLEALLRAERQAQPEPGAEGRIWAAVEHRLSHGPPPPSVADLPPAAVGGAVSGGGAVLKLVAGLALIATSVGGWAALNSKPSPGVVVDEAPVAAVPGDRSELPSSAAARADEPARAEVPVSVPEPIAEPEAEPVADEAPAKVARKKPRERAKVEPPKEEPAPVDFAEELRLISEIRGALKRGDSARALARVEEHARVFGARGRLVQERLAYQVEALCAAGRVSEARRVADDLLRKWPDSTHAPRVKSSCAGA
jgi:hypothetical protein